MTIKESKRMTIPSTWLVATIVAMGAGQVNAQTHASGAMAGHSMSADPASTTQLPSSPAPEAMPGMAGMKGMDHSKMGNAAAAAADDAMPAMPAMAGASQPTGSGADKGMGAMDHGKMQMQGGSAPADARDPHAYSGGTTLDDGPYALPVAQRLRLADEHNFASVLFNRFERSYGKSSNATAYDAQAWFGSDYDRLVVKAEGEVSRGKVESARTEILWGHAVATYWDTQLGARFDSGAGPDRSWLAFGVQGLSPYWFEVDAAAYVGNGGRTAVRLGAEYEILLTQKLVLQPRAEVNFYGKDDVARGVGSGLSDGVVGLRLRYEINKQFAPYFGVERTVKFGKTADIARGAGERIGDTRWVAGLRFWF
jgi:copper resistance protein B